MHNLSQDAFCVLCTKDLKEFFRSSMNWKPRRMDISKFTTIENHTKKHIRLAWLAARDIWTASNADEPCLSPEDAYERFLGTILRKKSYYEHLTPSGITIPHILLSFDSDDWKQLQTYMRDNWFTEKAAAEFVDTLQRKIRYDN